MIILTPASSRRIEIAARAAEAKWSHVHFRDNRDLATREMPLHCGGCWCGKTNGHEWPGKDEGEPHPRRSA